MPGKIKWRNKDFAKLKRVVKNFNAKITRILNKNPYASGYLPDKISYKELKVSIEYRSDFNNIINSLKRFSAKGAEKMVHGINRPVTKWERKEVAIKKGVLNRIRAVERKKLNPSPLTGTMGIINEMQLRPKSYPTGKTADWDVFRAQVFKLTSQKYRAEKSEKYLQNWKKAANNNLGRYATIVNILAERMGGKDLNDAYVRNDDLQIDYHYTEMDQAIKAGKIIEAFADEGIELTDDEKKRYAKELEEMEVSEVANRKMIEEYMEEYYIPDDF